MFNKFCQWLDLNRRPLVSEATALPTKPQPLPHVEKGPFIITQQLARLTSYGFRSLYLITIYARWTKHIQLRSFWSIFDHLRLHNWLVISNKMDGIRTAGNWCWRKLVLPTTYLHQSHCQKLCPSDSVISYALDIFCLNFTSGNPYIVSRDCLLLFTSIGTVVTVNHRAKTFKRPP